MSRKQLFRQSNNQTVAEIFERFVASQTAKGVSDKTIQSYYSHLHSLKKHLNFSAPLATLTKENLDNMVISMRQSGLAHNSISSYLRVFRTFLNWARKAGYTDLEMANYKDKETVKETYTDAELMLLLQKPARNCDFCEYRNWVIINFLVNCGCRAGTIRNIQNRDVDFERKQVIFRHTKTGKIQTIPLCSRTEFHGDIYKKVRFIVRGQDNFPSEAVKHHIRKGLIQRSFTKHSSLENILKIFGCRAVRPFSLYSSFPILGSDKSRILLMPSERMKYGAVPFFHLMIRLNVCPIMIRNVRRNC